ncbi:MAG: phosphotransferase family protein [Steroidobacteraceae bacterium]
MSTTAPPLDLPKLTAWLDARHPELGREPVVLERLSGGSSSSVFKLTRGAMPAVLRVPAWPPRADSLKAMGREARVLSALASTAVPHPRLLDYSGESDAIGVPFMLMSFVDGWLGSMQAPAPFDRPGPDRAALAYAMIDAVAELGQVDYKAIGLEDFGKPEQFLERQVDRWLKHIDSLRITENHPGRDIPGLHEVAAWLRANTPKMQRVSLIHSDVSFANVMFHHTAPARVAAIIDWEIATLGDPLLDLGRAVFPLPGKKVGSGKSRLLDFSDLPTREDLAQHYAKRTGLDVSHLDYYVVLSMFKLGAIIEFNYARMVNGRDSSGMAAEISEYILELFLEAKAVTESAG